jgi:hypothetical protein
MKKIFYFLVFLFLATPSSAEVGFNVTVGSPGFYLSIGNFFGYPEREVIHYHDRGIPDDDLPVVFFIAKYAYVDPDVVIRLRAGNGWPWSRICEYYRIPPSAFYYPIEKYGPPYGRAYGYYKQYPKKGDWGRIRLTDAAIVNQANLIFISKYYNYPPEQVVRLREQGSSFGNIERQVYRQRDYQERGGVPPQEMHRPGPPSEMHGGQGKAEKMPAPHRPGEGVRSPHARFQDVYPAIDHPSQRPEVTGRYDYKEKGKNKEKEQGRGHGKKD